MRLLRGLSPGSVRLLQLAATLLVALYMLFIGGTFDATLRFRVQLLNAVAGSALALFWIGLPATRRRGWHTSGLELPIFLFAGTQWLALLTSAQPRLGLEWAAGALTWGVAFCIVFDVLARGWPRAHVTNALLLVAALLAADGLWASGSWYLRWARLGQLPPVNFRYDGLLGHANLTAGILNLLLPLVVAQGLAGPWRRRVAMWVLAGAMLITEFFTSSRAGWLACAVSLAALATLLLYRRGGLAWVRGVLRSWSRRGWLLKAASVLGLGLAAVAGVWLLSKQARGITHGPLLEARQPFWTVAWDLFVKHSLTGAGPDLYPWFYSRYASIPPEFFAPHAHSGVFQILSGSGLLGFGALLVVIAVASWQLWRAWRAANWSLEVAALMAGLLSVVVHQLFDYLFGTPILPFLVVVLTALALAPPAGAPSPQTRRIVWLAPALLIPLGIFAFMLRAAYANDVGLTEAAAGRWQPAAMAFERAADNDPGITLYWEEAAYANTRAGQIDAALVAWRRAAVGDPNWAVVPASIGALQPDAAAAQAARDLAPGSYLFALNAGAIAETQGDASGAVEAYSAALDRDPASVDALFWQQTPQRAAIRDAWRAQHPPANSALAAGWAALANNTPGQAISQFQDAMLANPDSLEPYAGLGQTYLALKNYNAAQHAIEAGLQVPVTKLAETLQLHLVAGDVREASGDRAGAIAEYGLVFSAIDDYNIDGPGSYGDTDREWQVFHRAALPAELIPQLPRADLTPDMDQRFALLAQWYRDDGRQDLACLVLGRVAQAAPRSSSGDLFRNQCPPT